MSDRFLVCYGEMCMSSRWSSMKENVTRWTLEYFHHMLALILLSRGRVVFVVLLCTATNGHIHKRNKDINK